MNLYLPETFAGVLLVVSLALSGDLLLWRRSRSLSSFSESWLVGLGAVSVLLFPLSALAGSSALTLVLWIVALAAVANVMTFRKRPAENVRADRPTAGAVALFAVITAMAAVWAVYNLERSLLWDGFQIWATKAQLLYDLGRLAPDPLPQTGYLLARLEAYPPAVPLMEALVARLVGAFDFNATKPAFLFFLLSVLIAVYRGARTRLNVSAAMTLVVLTLLTPGIAVHYSAGGYADLPLAAFVAAAASVALRTDQDPGRSALPWLLGSCMMVKNEGVLVVAAAAALTVVRWVGSGDRLLMKLRRNAFPIGVVTAITALRFWYLVWIGAKPSGQFRSLNLEGVSAAVENVGAVCSLAAQELLNVDQWGLLWLAFAIAGTYLLLRGRSRERQITLALVLVVASYTAVFLFSRWEIDVHIPNAYPRLLTHVAPVAWICVAAAVAEAIREKPLEE